MSDLKLHWHKSIFWITLNKDKCLQEKEKIQFLGFWVIDKNGIAADSSNITAITEMKASKTTSEIRQF